ncbi:hypothetical protein [Falsirhodobacter sp. 1013]|uniref:hypothetical protein n=1 Tax=Falsirhodobacter sp. 1013 TaxID=3417566 RepID=UPI003EBCE4DE
MRKFFDPDHPALRPLWVRLLIIGVAVGWAGVEFANGSVTWGVLFLAVGGWAVWALLITYRPPK